MIRDEGRAAEYMGLRTLARILARAEPVTDKRQSQAEREKREQRRRELDAEMARPLTTGH